MNMETLSNNNFDRLEKLLRAKRFDELNTVEKQWVNSLLSEEEYVSMSVLYTSLNDQKQGIYIEPQADTKVKLNKALAAKVKRPGVFQLKMPMYQSVAAVLIFFLVGYGVHVFQPEQTRIINTTSQVIKYVERPVKLIQYVKVLVYIKEKKKEKENNIIRVNDKIVKPEMPEFNSEFIRQQEIFTTNFTKVFDENNGVSMSNDSLLQKMLVTIY